MQTDIQKKVALPLSLRVVLVAVLGLMAWAYWPVTRGDFVIDDYVFIATARMVEAPWAAFWQSHFYEPFYFRPIGVVSWWVAQRAFGLDYLPHALINLALHSINVLLLVVLLRALAVRGWALLAGAALFALAPFSLGPALWPSNRFDLLATGFLLLLAKLVLVTLVSARMTMPLLAALLVAIAACWSKELAYPVATAMAFMSLAARSASWRRRLLVFAALGVAIGGAFAWRHLILADAYAVVMGNPLLAIGRGLGTLVRLLPGLASSALGGERGVFWLIGLGLLLTLAVVGALFARRQAQTGWDRRLMAEVPPSFGVLAAVTTVALAAIIVQTPLAYLSAPIADGSPFGTITFLRFYYAPWAGCVVLAAVLLARAAWPRALSMVVLLFAIVGGVWLRPLGKSFAQWVHTDIRPYSVAATAVADRPAGGEPCLLVFLGTQTKHPLFRMFSDVTVKARAGSPEHAWRCFVMTESTPWLFVFPLATPLPEWPMPRITNPDGSAKPDSTWSTIRYRYRLPPVDLATLPGARFFDWRDGRFVEVTDEVRRGERKVPSRDWGM